MISIGWIFYSNLDSDNNDTHDGNDVKIIDLYFMRDNDSTLYWTSFGYDELKQTNAFIKSVRIGKEILINSYLIHDDYTF